MNDNKTSIQELRDAMKRDSERAKADMKNTREDIGRDDMSEDDPLNQMRDGE